MDQIIIETIEGYADIYSSDADDIHRERTDRECRNFLRNAVPEKVDEYFRHYEDLKAA